MALRIWDFSRIRFTNVTGPALPRRQALEIEGFDGVDMGDKILLRSSASMNTDTTAALTATAGKNSGQVIVTSGYSAPLDGGEGRLYWHAGATDAVDNGLVFGSGLGGRWKRIVNPGPVNVNWWGVLPDNDRLANDEALRRMRDALIAKDPSAHWRMVFGKPGVYKYSFNKWLCGFLDYTVDLNGSTLEYYYPEGWNVTGDTVTMFVHQDFSYLFGETGPGYNWFQNGGYQYHFGWNLATVASGSTSVTTTSNASKLPYLQPGDPVLIAGWNPAMDSYPPPYQFFEYNEVKSVVGTTVELRSRTKFEYKSTWHYNAIGADPNYGRACMFQLRGRSRDPAVASAIKYPDMCRNAVFRNGTVKGTWNYTDYGGARSAPHFYLAGYRSVLLENLEVDAVLQFTNHEQVIMRNVRQSGAVQTMTAMTAAAEIDKNITTMTVEDCRLGFLGGAQNVQNLALYNTVFEGRTYPQAQHVVIENCSFGQSSEGSTPITIERHATIRQTSAGNVENVGWVSCPEYVNSTGQPYEISALAVSNTEVQFATTGQHANFALPRGFPFNKGDLLMKTDGAYYGRIIDSKYPNTYVVRWSSTPSVGHQFQRISDWSFDYDTASGDGRWPGSMPSARGGSLTLESRDAQTWVVNRFFCPTKITSITVNVTKAATANAFIWIRAFPDDGGETLVRLDLAAAGLRTITPSGPSATFGDDWNVAPGAWTNLSTWQPRLRFDVHQDSTTPAGWAVFTVTINCERLDF